MQNEGELRLLRAAGLAAMAAAALTLIGDIVLLYSPGADYTDSANLFLLEVPRCRLMLGSLLGVFCLPVQALGIWQVSRAMRPAGARWSTAVLFVGIYILAVGPFFHGALALIAEALQAGQTELAGVLESYVQPVQIVVLLGFMIVLPALHVFIVGFRRTLYPRWMAAINPLTINLAVFGLGVGIPAIGQFILPAGTNITTLVYFGVSTALLWNPARALAQAGAAA